MKREKILITGFSGFVSRHFLEYLDREEIDAEICGVDLNEPRVELKDYKHLKVQFYKVNLLDKDAFRIICEVFSPQYILHLASYSSVAYSWRYPIESFNNNTNIFLNIASTIQELKLSTRILSIGSSEEYGNVGEENLPIHEDCTLKPLSPYSVARVSQELLSKVYAESYGVNIIMTRSFNHIGRYQETKFVIPSFVKQIVDIKKEKKGEGIIETGDISIVRDFVDVRDVVKAYYTLLKKGKVGTVYNICSGKGRTLREIIDLIADLTNTHITASIKQEYIRKNDNKKIIGSYQKIFSEFGWKPTYEIKDTLIDMIKYMDM